MSHEVRLFERSQPAEKPAGLDVPACGQEGAHCGSCSTCAQEGHALRTLCAGILAVGAVLLLFAVIRQKLAGPEAEPAASGLQSTEEVAGVE